MHSSNNAKISIPLTFSSFNTYFERQNPLMYFFCSFFFIKSNFDMW